MPSRIPIALLALAAGAPSLGAQPAGRVVADTVPAPALAGNLLGDAAEQPAYVYLPPGYDEEPDRRYATVYLLHGILDSPSVWVEPAYGGMTVPAVMDSLIAVGEIRPAIVVMPNGRNAYGGSMYMNSPVGGGWGDFIARDLVAHVDATYRTIADPGSRAITGHSMGGFGAIRLPMEHPGVFSVAWAMNPCCLCCLGDEPVEPATWRTLAEMRSAEDLWRRLEEERDFWPIVQAAVSAALSPDPDRPPLYFAPAFQVAGDSLVPTGALDRWAAALPLATVADHAEALRGLRGLALDSGFDDEFAHIPAGAKAFSDTLEALGVPHVYEVYDGDHRNRMPERLPGRILPWIDAALVHQPAPAAREPATIHRDAWGVPHVFGPTDASVTFAAAWVQAEEDWPAVEENFVRAAGRGAELFGEEALLDDYLARALEIPRLAREEYARAGPRMRRMLDAYAAGFEAYLAAHPDERRLLERVEPWHTLALLRFKYHQLEFLGYAGFERQYAARLMAEGGPTGLALVDPGAGPPSALALDPGAAGHAADIAAGSI
ncbi:MAG TPA: penicillin acylase family protein, partial [Gemmatimonadota bacterium]|nr:penicillin acylase family protein [Gemmatimonadota bacterium]